MNMKMNMKLQKRSIAAAVGFAMILIMGTALQEAPAQKKSRDTNSQIRRELVMLANYSVFDHLAFRYVPPDTVELLGAVTRPTLKSDAEAAVRDVPGIERIINKIEVLPPSPADDRIRVALYRAIFNHDQLFRYGLRAVPSIHIIVKNGNVELLGVVATETDKAVAGIVANSVPGIFSVANNLLVEGKENKREVTSDELRLPAKPEACF